ncbi:hypothetical protein [Demequina sp.]|uniref:ABC transporter substrate-binding protein n=1 Tax=Demequina sp. TaxID=2050685 RepID=UPI0025E16B39|nr:hypothetical protein [Demequina sp.]
MVVVGRNGRKLAAACLTAAAGMFVISGCSSSDPEPAGSSGGGGGGECTTPTEIKMQGTIKSEIAEQFIAAVDFYNENNTDCVKVEVLEGAGTGTFLQNYTTAMASGDAPTIFYTLQEIPDIADNMMDWTGQPLAALAQGDTLVAGQVGDKQVGIPSTVEAFGLLYNKTVLDAAGVDPMSVHTTSALQDAFDAVAAVDGVEAPMFFSGLWWSLGAHFTNVYHANSADTHEGRFAILDELKGGTKDLAADPVWNEWVDTIDMLKSNNSANASIADDNYDTAVSDLSAGSVGFWFMGNWAEPNLLEFGPDNEYGIMPLPINDDESFAGNSSISVGVPGYFMIDESQTTQEQRDAAVALLTWFLTTPEGNAYWSGPTEEGGMNFIPVYDGFTVDPTTYMAKEIASYVAAGNTLEWVNSAYPAGLQEVYGKEALAKYWSGTSDRAALATDMANAWK